MQSAGGRSIWSPVSPPDVIVVGAGVLGLCSAAELGARGRSVTVIDPGAPNASSAAAGMLAPVLECLSDEASPDRAALLIRARDLWPDFAARFGLNLHKDGVEWRGADPDADLERLAAFGVSARRTPQGLFTSEDWRVEVHHALDRLSHAPGVSLIAAAAASVRKAEGRWRIEAADGRAWTAPTIVLATGAAGPIEGLPEPAAAAVRSIIPWRGQLVPVSGPSPAHSLRAPGLYVVPSPGGLLIGATMERDRRDLEPDLEVARGQVRAGAELSGLAEGRPGPPRVGVRGGTADGLPLAGPAGEQGLHLATAPLRNGWLLGPLVARVVADAVEGRDAHPDAAALDPLRFS